MLANCQAIGNKVGHLSEKKHFFLASLMLHDVTPVVTGKKMTTPTFW